MPLLHLLEILPELSSINYILLENVVGFESSQARDKVVEVLEKIDFCIQEFHLCPSQFNIPNKRPRYYLLAKRRPCQFKYQTSSELVYKNIKK
jgi:tRNA (cytosine38-C5)-methyltransferase